MSRQTRPRHDSSYGIDHSTNTDAQLIYLKSNQSDFGPTRTGSGDIWDWNNNGLIESKDIKMTGGFMYIVSDYDFNANPSYYNRDIKILKSMINDHLDKDIEQMYSYLD